RVSQRVFLALSAGRRHSKALRYRSDTEAPVHRNGTTGSRMAGKRFGVFGQAARTEVIAVGAINAVGSLSIVEDFSSWGPAPIFFPTMSFRRKPDLAAFDGVTTTSANPGLNPFLGTSAAAPHSAAVAALLVSKNPALTPAEIQGALVATAVDIAPAGFDD